MVKKSCSILLVDTDRGGAPLLEKELKEHGHTVFQARDVAHAFSILEFRAFDVLVVDVESSREDHLNLINWAASLLPKPRIVAAGNGLEADQKDSAVNRGANAFFTKPMSAEKLMEFIDRTRSRSSFGGIVEGVDIIEYVQFVMLGGRKTILEVTSSLGTQGRLFLADGNIVHAVCGVLLGEQAMYRCLCFKEGSFRHLPWTDPEEITINKPGEFLLMEAVRKRDEAWSGSSTEEDGD